MAFLTFLFQLSHFFICHYITGCLIFRSKYYCLNHSIWLFLSRFLLESSYLNPTYISRNSKRCNREGLEIPSKIIEITFCPKVNIEMLKNYISISWNSLVFLFCYNPLLEEGVTRLYTYLIPVYSRILCAILVEIGQMVLVKVVNVFHYVAIISLWKNARPLI